MRATLLSIATVATLGCTTGSATPQIPEAEVEIRALLRVPDHFELPRIPDYNPVTADSIELGRRLFYDRRLSGNQTQACADCHKQEHAFADALRTPTGSTGTVLARNSPGLANVAWFSSLTWAHDGLIDLETQLEVPLVNDQPVELGINDGNFDEVVARLEGDPVYQRLLGLVWPDSPSGFTLPKLTFALASFCRSLVSGGSDFDRFYAGERDALSPEAKRGMTLFNGERFECFHCHGGVMATKSYRDAGTEEGSALTPFFNTGLYNVDGEGGYPPYDQGLFEVTRDPRHRGAFRPPSLRNVALTAPYMHDGSIDTLRDVLRTYMAGGRDLDEGPWAGDGRVNPNKSGLVRGFDATEDELDDVIAFLESMTDPAFLTDPAYANPWVEEP